MAQAFVENPDPVNYTVVDHIDENKSNYDPSNLRWVTPQTNDEHSNGKKCTVVRASGYEVVGRFGGLIRLHPETSTQRMEKNESRFH